jgi:hypothetical protein
VEQTYFKKNNNNNKKKPNRKQQQQQKLIVLVPEKGFLCSSFPGCYGNNFRKVELGFWR